MTKTCKKLISLLLVLSTVFMLTTLSVSAFSTDDEVFDCKLVDTGKVEIVNYDQSSKDVVIPETVKDNAGNSYTVVSLDIDTFGDIFGPMIESLSIPGSIKTIKSGQFQNFTSLKTLTLSDGLETIGSSAFSNCTSLTSVVIPDSVKTIGSFAFGECSDLKSIEIGKGVENIPSTAFDRCTSLETVYLGVNTKSVNETAFRGCTSLKTVYAYDKLKTFPLDSIDIDSVTFYSYADSELYNYLENNSANVIAYEIDGLALTVDAEMQKYAMTDSVLLHKDGLKVVADYDYAPDVDVTEKCELSTNDDFSTPGDKTVTVSYGGKTATYTAKVFGLTGLIVTVDAEKQKYAMTDSVGLHKDGLKVVADYVNADDVDVTNECTISTEDDFSTPGDKTVTVSYGGKTATYTVKVFDFSFSGKPQNITINYKDAYRFTLLTTDIPEGAKIVWSTSNPKILTVDQNGNLKTIKRGTATITAKIEGTDVSASCNVTVKYTWWQWILIIVLFGWIWYR